MSSPAAIDTASPVRFAAEGKLRTIEAVRGLAALLVAFYHGERVVELFKPGWGAPFDGFFKFGHAGVDFFFVLSGFIIFHVHHGDLGCPSKLKMFAWKRLVRIYPLFLVVMVPVTAKFVAAGKFEWDYFVKSILLLPQAQFPMLIASWTLVHEALFYLLFGLAIAHARLGRLVLGLWLLLFIAVKWLGPDFGTGFPGDLGRTMFSNYNLLFLLGIGAAWLVHRGPLPCARLMAVVGGLGFLASGLLENTLHFPADGALSVLLFGLNSTLIITGLAAAESAGRIKLGRHANWLGDLSYPLYLTHGMVISVTVPLLGKLLHDSPNGILLLTVALACVAATLINRYVEKPLTTLIRNAWRPRPVPVLA